MDAILIKKRFKITLICLSLLFLSFCLIIFRYLFHQKYRLLFSILTFLLDHLLVIIIEI